MATYDFIVVGAGSAGCAVAGRLAGQSSARVLLLEAGGSERRFLVRAPQAFGRQLGTLLDWGYESESEPGCAGRRIPLPRGRVLGGTSAMNAMVWVRGSDLDYDGWGLDGWAWRDVGPVFDRIERDTMRITRVQSPDELSTRFVAAARAAICGRARTSPSKPRHFSDGSSSATTGPSASVPPNTCAASGSPRWWTAPALGRGSPTTPTRSRYGRCDPASWACPTRPIRNGWRSG